MTRYITIQQLDGSERQLTNEDLPIIIGSGPTSHIKLPEGETVAAYIGEAEGHLFLQPVDRNEQPLFHNDRHLRDSAWLKSNDRLQSGTTIISYQIRGDRILITVTTAENQPLSQTLRPPHEPPPGPQDASDPANHIPVEVTGKKALSKKKKIALGIIGSTFFLLGLAVLFVLLARPLEIEITPEPDATKLSGFPPPFKIGSRYLCLPGSYRATVEKQGYVELAETIIVDKSCNNRFAATLEKLPGILKLSATPADGVSVYSGNTLIGTTPPVAMEIPHGNHTLKIIKERYQPFHTDIAIVGEGKTQTVVAKLQPDWADITITSDPRGADISIDGQTLGITPLTLELLSGEHEISLTKELYSEKAHDISVIAGKAETHDIQLQLLPGQLYIATTPSQAAITLDNVYKGTTPLTLLLSSEQEHEISLTAPGYKTIKQQVNLGPGEKREIELPLEQEQGVIYLTTHPPDASITINGKRYSNSQGKLVLPVSPQQLEVKAPGYTSTTRTLLPKAGFSQQISVNLLPIGNTGIAFSGNTTPEAAKKTKAGQKLLYVEPSPFIMGAPRREPGRRANERERKVILKRPFYLSEKPVTNHDYRLFKSSHNSGMVAGLTLDGDIQPVVNISWEDAVRYLNWLSVQDNLQPFYSKQGDGFIPASPPTNGYRLPTEAEWAFCARQKGNPPGQRFPWNGVFPPHTVTGNYADESAGFFIPHVIRGYNDSFAVSSPVGSFPANKGGFFDMGGNIAEWCHDYYSAYTSTLKKQPDPLGPASGTHRVIRGSSWRDASVTELRLSYRPYHRAPQDNVGFRIARYR